MGLRVNHKALLVGVMATVVLGLAFLLVPTITADLPSISTLGNVDLDNLHSCLIYDPTADPAGNGVTLVATYVDVKDSMFDEHPGWYPEVNALMRCEGQIDNYTGPAFTTSGNDYGSAVNCLVALEPDNQENPHYKFSTNWTETVSANGSVVLNCRFKKFF